MRQHKVAMIGSAISATLTKEVVVGSIGSVYLSPLTITSAWRIKGSCLKRTGYAFAVIQRAGIRHMVIIDLKINQEG
jgi:hypothetical protein